ncbi:MAG: amidohydrolase [Clostridia bacterium]|nr:amidohydrolase [Clostridia bacterium]
MKQIYWNGQVYTGTDALSEAFVVEDGRFIYAGGNEGALACAGEADEKIDLQGRFVCPGFIDSHMHVLSYGLALTRAKLNEHTGSLEELVNHLIDFARENPSRAGGWIVGRGWNHDYFTDVSRMPNRYDLDRVSTEYPVVAVRCCGHSLVVNSKVIEMLGVTADTESPAGGSIGIENGEPDGRFYDNAMDAVYAAIPDPSKEDIKNMMRAAIKRLNAYGVTSAQTDDYSTPWRMVNEAYRELEESGELTVRIYEQSNFQSVESLKEFIHEGNVTGSGSELFKIGPLKLLGDGSLGARTAFLSRPYSDNPSTCGLPVYTQELLDDMISCAHENGMQVAVHAIGDGCLERVLSAFEKAQAAHPRADHRHGIVHCQITREDQLKKMIDMDLHIYAQSIFIDYDANIVRQRVGDMADTSYSWKTLMQGGLSVSNGSDCPVEMPNVLLGMQCAVTRTSLHGDGTPYLPDQAFTVSEAIDSFTIRGAEGSFEEQIKGRIQPGMLADFVVLDKSPFSVDPACIKDISVLATYLGGKRVYSAE